MLQQRLKDISTIIKWQKFYSKSILRQIILGRVFTIESQKVHLCPYAAKAQSKDLFNILDGITEKDLGLIK